MSKSHVGRVRELYKLILRVHRSLPDELKILGDNYAREEFKRHKKCKPQEAKIFLNEWREYAVSMSRQVAPARAERRPPVDEQQARPARRLRVADPEQAAGGGEVSAADPGQAAEGREVRALDVEQDVRRGAVRAAVPGQAAEGRQVRGADLGQALGRGAVRAEVPEQAAEGREVRAVVPGQAAGGGEVRAVVPGQAAGGGEVRAVVPGQAAGGGEVRAEEQAGVHPRFGIDLDLDRVRQLSPEQLLNLFNLLMAAAGRGGNPDQYENEPVDIGIELIKTDVFAKLSQQAKKHILRIDKEEFRNFLRGEEHENLFNKELWFELLDDAQLVKNFEEFQIAAGEGKVVSDEAKEARLIADIAKQKTVVKEIKASNAIALAESTKQRAALAADKNKYKLEKKVKKLEKNAMKKVNKAEAMGKKTEKLAMEAKSKEFEAKAAYEFCIEICDDIDKDLKYK